MFGPVKNIIFDMDGTLVDSMSHIVEGMQKAIAKVTGNVPSSADLVNSFGPDPRGVLAKWVPADKVEEVLELWFEYGHSAGASAMRAFVGVEEMLAALKAKNIHMCVFTGRDRKSCIEILNHNGWIPKYFSDEKFVICGDDDFDPKPSGDAILELMKRFNLKPEETLMVGDHIFDMQAGRYAGVKTAAVIWDLSSGQGPTERSKFKAQWNKWPESLCDLRLSDPMSLVSWLSDETLEEP